MKITIVAATGGIGRQLLEQAVAAGHDVTAVARTPAKLGDLPPDVRVFRADLMAADPATLESAMEGADAVLSGLGPRSKADFGVVAPGTRSIVKAMQATDARRLVVVSAAPVGTVPSPGRPHPRKTDPGEGFFMRSVLTPIVKRAFHGNYVDLALAEDALRDSGLDWTAMRPPRLTNGPLTRSYRTAYGQNIRGGMTISRADVAHAMLASLEDPDSVKETIGLAS